MADLLQNELMHSVVEVQLSCLCTEVVFMNSPSYLLLISMFSGSSENTSENTLRLIDYSKGLSYHFLYFSQISTKNVGSL